MSEPNAVDLTFYHWAGSWGPFKIKIPCGECSLTNDVIQDTLDNELAGINVNVSKHEWLSNWWKPLIKGGWHAPIIMVDGQVVSQGNALNRGVLTQRVVESYTQISAIKGNHVYGKETCPHCQRAKRYLDEANIDYEYHDIIKNPRDMYEMLGRVKPIIGEKTPVTVPQIWLDGAYIGGADELEKHVKQTVEPNNDRGRCSMSPAA